MTPEQEEQARRALAAAARADDPGPMPPEVVARLTGVLDELAAPRRASGAEADGPDATETAGRDDDELTARRGRRRLPRPNTLVAAAAAALVVAAGGTVAVQGLGGGGADSAQPNAGGSVAGDAAEGSGSAPEPESAPQSAPQSAPSSDAPRDLAAPEGAAGLTEPQLRSGSLRADVRRVAVALAGLDPAAEGYLQSQGGAGRSDRKVMVCDAPPVRRGGATVVVRLDGRRATLVLGPADGGTREAEVYSCADPRAPIARTVVEAP